ncbi:MAG: hypothetical protein MR415_00925 [Coriobacteriaceae bacterium]|nr:hypothetical protein [Coriobacteriaceae bacterium]
MTTANPTPMHPLHIYKMTSDTGFAPCYQDGLLSLVCCKPRMRRSIHNKWEAQADGDRSIYAMGVAGKGLAKKDPLCEPGSIVWFARINDVISMEDYYRTEQIVVLDSKGTARSLSLAGREDHKAYVLRNGQLESAGYGINKHDLWPTRDQLDANSAKLPDALKISGDGTGRNLDKLREVAGCLPSKHEYEYGINNMRKDLEGEWAILSTEFMQRRKDGQAPQVPSDYTCFDKDSKKRRSLSDRIATLPRDFTWVDLTDEQISQLIDELQPHMDVNHSDVRTAQEDGCNGGCHGGC